MMNSCTTNNTNNDLEKVNDSGPPSTPPPQQAPVDRSFNRFNFINFFAYLFNCAITFGIGILGWNNRPDNGDLSAIYQTIITPWGTAFSIWGPIFIVQLIWVIWQLLPSQRNKPGVLRIGYLYLAVCLSQAGWTMSFSYEIIWLSFIFMLSILAFLAVAVVKMQAIEKCWKGYFLWQFPFSIHFGWILAASAVNFSVVGVAYGASATAQLAIAGLSLAILLGVATAILLQRYPSVDLTPPLVLVWGLGGVYGELQNPGDMIVATFTEAEIEGFQTAAIVGAGVILGAVIVKMLWVVLVSRRNQSTTSGGTEEKEEVGGDYNAKEDTSDEEE